MNEIGKTLILLGAFLVVAGIFATQAGKLPWLGKLPGDFRIERPGFVFYFPLATGLLLSAALSALLWIASKFK